MRKMNRNKDDPTGKECDDLSMSASAKEFVDKGAIFECQWNVISLDDKKRRIRQYKPNIPHIEFFNSLGDEKLKAVMSKIEHHTWFDFSGEGGFETSAFYLFSEKKYLKYYDEVMEKMVEGHFPIEVDLMSEGGEFYTILPDESDRYISDIDYVGVPVTIRVSPLERRERGMRKADVTVGDKHYEWTMEDNEYMDSTVTEVIILMNEGKIGTPIAKKKASKKKKDKVVGNYKGYTIRKVSEGYYFTAPNGGESLLWYPNIAKAKESIDAIEKMVKG